MTEPVSIALAASAAASSAAAAASPGFFVATFGLIAAFMLSWPALIGLIILGILFEHNGARGWSVFTALVVAATAYFFFSVSLLAIGIGAVVYVVIGLAWSFWRYKRHAEKIVEANCNATSREKEHALAELHPKAMLPTITAWILIWPFSMVENIAGDIINFVQSLITKFFRGVYHRIYDSAVASLK